MKILVTGGAGYLGSVLTHKLLGKNYFVTVLDIGMLGAEGLLPCFGKKNFTFIKGDIRDQKLLEQVFKKKFDAVIHLAALVGEPACDVNPKLAWQINHEATVHLGKLAKKQEVKRFVFMSSSSNYGVSLPDQLADENSTLNPLTLYSKTKVAAEKDLLPLADKDFTASIIRLAALFGLSPKMRFNLLINEMVRNAVYEKDIVLYKENAWRPYTHTEDAADAVIAILLAKEKLVGGEVFNVGSQNYRKKDLLVPLKKYIKKIRVLKKGGEADNRDYRVSFEKIHRVLGFKPEKTVEEGIAQMIFALKNNVFNNPYDENYSVWIKPEFFV